ncbi:Aste57867_9584 [Aphanomyces stellatus]|uniref:non-specific serine/threonine protein kinase n=1 Tax=Aphanomyces stellatus TaxID=120398 RepID=A0A485KN87_9STRA|nr:hypothetical protein As57867_009546 [Aphanomyces stellatus]VFT86463.1 Aste57867_9584 [Aphanomyces stellatus]
MSEQQLDYPSLLLRLYHQSQGPHKGAKKAQEELANHLQTTSLPVECFDTLLPQFLLFLSKGDGPAKWLGLLFASNLLRTTDIMGMMHPPPTQKILLSILPDTIERWWRLVEEQDNSAQLNMRDGVFVPNAILQSEKIAQKSTQLFALGRLVDTLAQMLRLTDDEEVVDLVARSIQVILKHAKKGAVQKVFVRLADVLIAWVTRHETSSDRRDVLVRTLFDMKDLWSDNTVYSLQLVASFAHEIEDLATSTLTRQSLLRLNTIVVCFMAVAHGLRTFGEYASAPPDSCCLVLATDSLLLRVLHTLTTLGDKYILSIDTVSTSAQALVVIAQAAAASAFDPLCIPAVDFVLLHLCMLFQRHLATASEMSSILDRVLVLLELSTVQFSLPVVNMLTRRLPSALPAPHGIPTPLAPAPVPLPPHTYLSFLCTVSQANVLLKLTRVCVQCVRLGGIAALHVFCLDAVASHVSEYTLFSLLALSVSLTAPVTLVPGDAVCLASMFGRLVHALPKWTDVLFLNAVKAIHCLIQFMQLHIQPPIKPADTTALVAALMRHLVHSPHALVFQVLDTLVSQASFFQLALPLAAPSELHALASHPNEQVRCHYLQLLRSVQPSPATLDLAVERLFDSSPTAVANAMHIIGRVTVARLGQPGFRSSKKPVPVNGPAGEFGLPQFETLMQCLETGEPLAACLALLRQTHHPTPLLALKAGVWEAASWCVFGRLRTHWGNAGQTFAAIEKLVLKPVAYPRLVVEFVHALEMAIVHVTVDETTDETQAKAVAFFKTNRKVCDDWLLRIRPALIRLCEGTGASSLSRYHALSLVTNLARKPATPEWDTAMFQLCSACYDLQDTPGLHGLVRYATSLNQFKPWMAPMQLEAQMNYEHAIRGYRDIAAPLIQLAHAHGSGLNLQFEAEDERATVVAAVQTALAALRIGPVSFKGIILRCAQCLAILQDWPACRAWMEQILDLAAFLTNVQGCMAEELAFATALAPLVKQWEVEIKMLDPRDDLPALREWTVLSVVDDANFRQLDRLDDVSAHTTWLEQRLRVLAIDERACTPRKGANMSRQLQRTLMHVQCFVQPHVPPSLTLDPTAHDLGVWHPLATRHASFDLQVIRLARKQLNFHLAQSKLAKLSSSTAVGALTIGYEHAQLLNATKQKAAAWDVLQQMHERFSAVAVGAEKRIQVKTLIKLASWAPQPHMQQGFLQHATELDPQSYQAWLSWSDYWYNVSQTQLESMVNHQYSLTIEEKQEFTTIVDTYPEVQPMASTLLAALQNFESFSCAGDVKGPAAHQFAALYQKARARVLSGYRTAVQGYVTYLSCASSSSLKSHGVIVTLRLLSVLVKQGSEPSMQSVLDMAVHDSPLEPWERVVPQLLSRLAHPDLNASSRVESILMRLASHSPHLIVYPAVVESTKLTEALDSVLVAQVRQLITEFRRISVLWDEAWLTLLTKLASDVARRSHTLEKEAARVEKNTFLSRSDKLALAQRKFVAIMKPVLLALDTLAQETIKIPPQTPHEHWFVLHFGDLIASALLKFERCLEEDQAISLRQEKKKSLSDPLVHVVWSPFADIVKRLHHASHHRQSLPMTSISPIMASWESSLVHMPGLPTRVIQGVSPQVQVLATKTKPKCLELVGSDGHAYRYLLKAREDLHLDERIMQLLATVNGCLSTDKEAMHYDLTARHYSVIPLSNDAGLIQMVPNVTPLFHIYTSATNHASATSPTAPFYAKLKASGITDVTPSGRPQWPLETLRQVYTDLVNEHPKLNVLVQEMLRQSRNVEEFGAKSTRFSRSVAVMSVVGYIIGLGDRHLDNMLLCHSGDLVHIDYNVCFDKGKKLKVPEIVPFRLTSIVHGALGLTGTEGRFRHSMETTLRVMRAPDTKETILTLLEAFVYDPLVDWKEGPTPKKLWRMEMNVQLSLFSSRAQERRSEADAALAHVTDTWRRVEEKVTALRSAAASVLGLMQQTKSLEADEASLRNRLHQLTNITGNGQEDDDAAAELERAFVQASEELDRFCNECQGREDGLRQWLQVPDMGLPWTWGGSDRPSFVDVCADLPRDDALADTCRTIDKAAQALATLLTQWGAHLQPALIWYKHMRGVLYDTQRGPSVYQEWLDYAADARTGRLTDASLAATWARERLNRRLNTLALTHAPSLSHDTRSTTVDACVDTASVHAQMKQLSQTLASLKTEWKLSNAQAQKMFKLAVAHHWLHEETTETPSSWNEFTRRLWSTSWLIEMVHTPKGSFRNLPLDDWLLRPEIPTAKHPALQPLEDLVSAYDTSRFLVMTYMGSMQYGPGATAILEGFQHSLDQAYALPAWHELMDTMEWVENARPLSSCAVIPLVMPTNRPTSPWDISGMAPLREALNVLCAVEIKLTPEPNVQAIQFYWLQTLATVARLVVVHRQPQDAATYLTTHALPLLLLASSSLEAIVYDTCVSDWKFKLNAKAGALSHPWLASEWKHAMPLDIPCDLDGLSARLGVAALVDSMTFCAHASLDQSHAVRRAHFLNALRAATAQQHVLATWLNVVQSDNSAPSSSSNAMVLSRPSLLALVPNMDDAHRHVTVLQDSVTAMTIQYAHDPAKLATATATTTALVHEAQALGVCFRWIEYVESTFRDSHSDTCRAVDAEGDTILASFVRAKTAWAAHQEAQRARADAAAANTRSVDAMQHTLATVQAELAAVRHALAARVDATDLATPLMDVKRLVPDVARHDKTAILWENERLVKILSKSIKRDVDELSDLQATMATYETTSAGLHAHYTSLVHALVEFAARCPDMDGTRAATMASVVRGKETKPATSADKYAGVDAAFALTQALDASQGLAATRRAMEHVLELFIAIADQATTLSHESPSVNDSESSSSSSEDESESDDEMAADFKKVQERNTYGMHVLKRVKDKLDGEATKQSVEEQVHWLIGQATSVDNLCQMYEGWTPWI